MPEGENWLYTYEVAEMLRVSPKTVSQWAKHGKLPHTRTLGGRTGHGHRRYPRVEIEAIARDLGIPLDGEPS
jgi:excisionase family DNA binding protein